MRMELARRIAFTIGALLIFRLGSQIPLAGISAQGGLLSSGAVGRVSIFSLTLVPYLGAAIFVQLVSVVWGRLSALERAGEAGRRRIARYTLILTLVLAAFQAFGIASALQDISGLVPNPAAGSCCRLPSRWWAACSFWSGSASRSRGTGSATVSRWC